MQVPDKYICSVCVAPPLARQSSLYTLDMDWIREGKLSRMDQEHEENQESVKTMESELKNLSDLMTDLVNLSSVLHSLQVKLSVARQKNNPKVFMWSNVWEETSIGVVEEEVNNITEETDNTFETVDGDGIQEDVKNDLKLVKEELENHISDNKENDKVVSNGDVDHVDEDDLKLEPSVVKNEENIDKPVNSSLELKETDKLGEDKHQENDESSENDETKSKVVEQQELKQNPAPVLNNDAPSSFNSQLVDYFSSEGFDIPANLLPSVSEIQRMLPDVIKDISGGLSGTPTAFSQSILTPTPPPNIIPEPKRLDRDECRQNLLDHIETLQKHVEDRLEMVEDQIENVERRRKSPPGVWSGMMISSKMQDVRSAKIVNNTLPDRL